MAIRRSAEEAGRRLRAAGEEAGWSAREAAWALEERVLWPLSDRLDVYGAAGRTALATLAVTAAAAAGIAGAQLASTDGGGSRAAHAVASAEAQAAAPHETLSGVRPDFERTADATRPAAPPETPAQPTAPKAAPEQVAWRFAQAFASYEVGKADERTAAIFSEVAVEPLAEALGEEPPRLPESAEVPEAKVLNVVLGKRRGSELQASVSLLRLQAANELRLTLRRDKQGWRVAEVRG